MSTCIVNAEAPKKEHPTETQNITDIYISVFFDGTGNNIYEQINKSQSLFNKLKRRGKQLISKVTYSSSPTLFSANDLYHDMHKTPLSHSNKQDLEKYGMKDYNLQKEQAEYDYTINDTNNKKNADRAEDSNDNGGWKYSNVAILRSLTKTQKKDDNKDGNDIKGINYNLYIEGSGKLWNTGSDFIALGMGVGRSGVVGLVSKAVVMIGEFVDSVVEKKNRQNVNIHFAVFGFSRGSTCGRLFSYLIASPNQNDLPRKAEFGQYLPEKYFNGGEICFLKEYSRDKLTVDFLGIYDTVSAIGFLQKDDNTTNHGMNLFSKQSTETDAQGQTKTWYVNAMHGTKDLDNATIAGSVAVGRIVGGLPGAAIGGVAGYSALKARDAVFGDAINNFHRNNVREYGLYSPQFENVKHTFQICAMDEFRENFALVDLGGELDRCTEIFMPGCHSDIGGGYMDCDRIDKYTLRRKINGKDAMMYLDEDPKSPSTRKQVSQDTMEELGWFGGTTQRKQWFTGNRKESWKGKNQTMTRYIFESDTKLEFELEPKEGYSNITLELMKERALDSQYGLNWPFRFLPFQKKTPKRFNVTVELAPIKSMAKGKLLEGQRSWVIPNKELYKRLRLQYLHFTATDELNLEKGHFSASGANVGNPPYWRNMGDYYLLCRIVYRGEPNDNQLHFMSEY